MRDAPTDRYGPLAVGVGVVVAAAALLTPDVAQGCAVCLGAVDDPLARGLNWSILFLAAMPFTIVGSIGGWLLYKYRRRPRVVRRGSPQAEDRQAQSSRTSPITQKGSWS